MKTFFFHQHTDILYCSLFKTGPAAQKVWIYQYFYRETVLQTKPCENPPDEKLKPAGFFYVRLHHNFQPPDFIAIQCIDGFAYLVNYEFVLCAGRVSGCALFLAIAALASQDAALRYALLVIGALQFLTIFAAGVVIKKCETIAAARRDSK